MLNIDMIPDTASDDEWYADDTEPDEALPTPGKINVSPHNALLVALLIPGLGAVLHLALFGPNLDWNSAWTLSIILGWPILLAGLLLLAAILGAAMWGLTSGAAWALRNLGGGTASTIFSWPS